MLFAMILSLSIVQADVGQNQPPVPSVETKTWSENFDELVDVFLCTHPFHQKGGPYYGDLNHCTAARALSKQYKRFKAWVETPSGIAFIAGLSGIAGKPVDMTALRHAQCKKQDCEIKRRLFRSE